MAQRSEKKIKRGGKKTAYQGRSTQILIRVADSGGSLTTNDLAEMLEMKANNVSAYIATLQKEGFIETRQGGENRTLHFHSLTAKGRQHLDGIKG